MQNTRFDQITHQETLADYNEMFMSFLSFLENLLQRNHIFIKRVNK